jgi:hypothetical protein
MDNKEKVKYWLDIADYDLQTARAMFSSKRYLYVSAGNGENHQGLVCKQS